MVIFAIVLAVVGVYALVYYWFTQREYRPSVSKVRRIIESSLEETLDPETLDEFSIVRIQYRPELDEIRKRFNLIVNDPQYMKSRHQDDRFVSLNNGGRAELKALLRELELLAA